MSKRPESFDRLADLELPRRAVVVVMTVHKLSAGDGYTYLTRQVASADEVRPAGQTLGDYYTARGNSPGVWLGRGADGLGVGGTEVSEVQMRALFGSGLHPNADTMLGSGLAESDTRLGARYPTYTSLPPLADRMERRVAVFTNEHRRPPTEAEQRGMAAQERRRDRRAVAGFDLVFSPVKSASLLWALGGPEVRTEVENAHHEAVRNTIAWIEEHAAFTRTGHAGIAQIDTHGLVAAAFDHRESRAGDPDLHTHVAVANKVQGADGKWRSLDARGLHALGVAASERYNTRLEDALARRLGVQFEERPGCAPGKRPVREVVGIPVELIRHFSRRRALVENRLVELRDEYRAAHGREPGRAAELQLAQQATLETREGKRAARTLAEQVRDWSEQARQVLGGHRMSRLVLDCLHRPPRRDIAATPDVEEIAGRVVREIAERRSTWTVWNIYAEAERQTRALRFPTPESREMLVDQVVAAANSPAMSIRISEPELVREPDELSVLIRESDGQSVFVPHGSDRFTTSEVLLAEDRLVDAGRTMSGPHLDPLVLEAAVAIQESRTGVRLDPGQRELAAAFALSPHLLGVGIGPAGTGKTTAMSAVASAWQANGGRVVPLATSARAADLLGSELGLRAENLHKFLFENQRLAQDAGSDQGRPVDGRGAGWFQLRRGDLVLVDEAGMAGTLNLAALVRLADDAGATVRLLGDPAQLASVEAGGALRLLEREIGATYLTELHRFTDPDEAAATLALRGGDTAAVDFYERRDRIKAGSHDDVLDAAFDAWAADTERGLTSVLVAGANADVVALNHRARSARVDAGDVQLDGVALHDDTTAGVGDRIVTRANARTLRVNRGGWVRNGDAWRVVRTHRDGSLTVRALEGRARVRLPAEYVATSVELGYATTVHRVQGATTDTAHALVSRDLTREGLYVASTRGRRRTTWYASTEQGSDVDCGFEPQAPTTARELLTTVLARRSRQDSARATIQATLEDATSSTTLIGRYRHAWSLAAQEILREATEPLPAALRQTLTLGPGAAHLAHSLATAAGRYGDASELLTAAIQLGDLESSYSTALEIADRLLDQRGRLGTSTSPQTEGPAERLPIPEISHAGWRRYLRDLAALILEQTGDSSSAPNDHRRPPLEVSAPPAPGRRRVPVDLPDAPRPPTPGSRTPSSSRLSR